MRHHASLSLVGSLLVLATGCGQTALAPMPALPAAPQVRAAYPAQPGALKPLTERLTVNPGQFYMAFGSEPRKVTLGMQHTQTKIGFSAELFAGGHGQGWDVVPKARLVKVSGLFDTKSKELTFNKGPLTEQEVSYFKGAITPWPPQPGSTSQTAAARVVR